MTIDVYTPIENGRWHWQINGPMNKDAGAVGSLASCCDGGKCKGFDEKEAAEKAGWDYAKANKIK
jgi:hypothetical protein